MWHAYACIASNEIVSLRMQMSQINLQKPKIKFQKLPLELFVRRVPRTPQTTEAIAVTLDCFLQVGSSVPVSKGDTQFGHRIQRIWADSDLKECFWRTSFHDTRKFYASYREKWSIVSLRCVVYIQQQDLTWYGFSKGSIAAFIICGNQQLSSSLKTHSTGKNSTWYWKQS